MTSNALSQADIDAIYKHCVENKWSLYEYLQRMGFDMSAADEVENNGGRMLVANYYDTFEFGGFFEKGVEGYQIYKNTGKEKCYGSKYYSGFGPFEEYDLHTAKDQWESGKDMVLLMFRKAGQKYYRDELNVTKR